MMTVPVTWANGVPDFGPTQVLFKVPRLIASNLGFDVAADGQKFIVILGGEQDASPLTLVVHAAMR